MGVYIKNNGQLVKVAGTPEYVETDPTVPSWVKSISQTDINSWDNKAEISDIPTDYVKDNDARLSDARPASNVTDIYSETGTTPVSGKAIASAISDKVDKEFGKGLSTNDFTNTYKSAIDNLPTSYAPIDAEKNTIIGIQKNGTDIVIDNNRKVDITVPTQASDIGAMSNAVTHLSGDVPVTRKINGKELSSDITLNAADINALASTITHLNGDIAISEKGVANGVATLGSDGKVPENQLPSYVDDVLEYASIDNFPEEGESGKIYIDILSNKTYRWSGSIYVEISSSLALGETSSTAYAGNKGKATTDAFNTHATNTTIHVTSDEKFTWSGKYNKPEGGIPSSDLSDDVQTSLGKADSALQSISKTDVTTALGYIPPRSDTNTTYTFEGGVNCFAVTPSGGSKQVINITPSITASVITGELKISQGGTGATTVAGAKSNLEIPTVSATQALSRGTEIGSITVNGTETKFFAPQGGGSGLTKLWENPTPDDNFAAQSISINLTDFTGILIGYRANKTSTAGVYYSFLGKDENTHLMVFSHANTGAIYMWSRAVQITGNSIKFENGYRKEMASTSTGSANAQYLIPTVIYGIA